MIVINGMPGIKYKFFAKAIDESASFMMCYNNFSVPRVDIEILAEAEYKQDMSSIDSVDILGGSFSRVFLEQLRKTQDVHVLNIIRNPSVSYVTGTEDLFENDELPVGLAYVTPMTTSASIDAITLSKLDYVTTIKFEDIIKTGSFEFMGQIFKCPAVHNNYNGTITKYESVMIKRGIIDSAMVDRFNQIFSSLNTSFINCHNDPRLPGNVFEELGYTPLTLQEMLNESL
jgi:hypothetical protein